MASPDTVQMWHRVFSRDGDQPFEDFVADQKFADEHFVDFFGKTWAPAHPEAFSFDAIVRPFYEDSKVKGSKTFFEVYAVSEGSKIRSTDQNRGWLSQSIRFIAVITGHNDNVAKKYPPFRDNNGAWTLFVVGSGKDVLSDSEFLQVASWDNNVLRFYERTRPQEDEKLSPAWIYLGDSRGAFDEATAYLGPFNGHVNGSVIMKELHEPWLHWIAVGNQFREHMNTQDLDKYDSFPYLSDSTSSKDWSLLDNTKLSRITGANSLEQHVQTGIQRWIGKRQQMDLLDSQRQPRQKVENVQRWLAHVLLTTTINMSAALPDTTTSGKDFKINPGHFYNSEVFKNNKSGPIQPQTVEPFLFKPESYEIAVDNLRIALVHQYPRDVKNYPDPIQHPKVPKVSLGGRDEPVDLFVAQFGEGEGAIFNTIQSSYEDIQGVIALLSPPAASKIPIISKPFLFAMIMVDPWNPVYSWRRGVLMQYVPESTSLPEPYDPKANPPQSYDLEMLMESAVKASPRFKDASSPEREFINNLEAIRAGTAKFGAKMDDYIKKVILRLLDASTATDAMLDYMKLAESRRRIFRPVPLDEFALAMPYATVWPESDPRYEMTSEGTIVPMAARGQKFFQDWISSLADFQNPQMIPRPDKDDATDTDVGALSTTAVMSVSSSLSCQASARIGCPAMSRKVREPVQQILAAAISTDEQPTWDDHIAVLFSAPPWIKPQERAVQVGKTWLRMMIRYGAPIPPSDKNAKTLQLDNYEQVKLQAITIYHHVASRSMPVTSDPDEYWPDDAVSTLRLWVNQGCRKSAIDGFDLLQPPLLPIIAPVFRTRKDIRNLTPEEIFAYRSKLEHVLGTQSLKSKWQELGELHAWWCLHYQEATFFWHRCYLRYVEHLIDFPIPYWNGFATDAADPESEFAGIPKIFLEDTYLDSFGTQQPNPLKWAYSYQGQSKSGGDQKQCQRNPILEQGRTHPDWVKHIKLFTKYHEQIVKAMQQPVFSLPQRDPTSEAWAESAWAWIGAFKDDMPDDDYIVAAGTFDGHLEQAHDNFHGWVGGLSGEMADNTYTAFDPIFLSYHCNMDRLFDHYLRSHPGTKLSADFPLKPFIDRATALDYTNPNSWAYTTTGDMAKPLLALGYTYAPPACADVFELAKPVSRTAQPSGGVSVQLLHKSADAMKPKTKGELANDSAMKPAILFEDVVCTEKSYEIDIFLNGAQSEAADIANPDFVGRLFRFGMGVPPAGVEAQIRARCLKESVTRIVDASSVSDRIRETGWYQTVKELNGSPDGVELEDSEWSQIRGFKGKLVWLRE